MAWVNVPTRLSLETASRFSVENLVNGGEMQVDAWPDRWGGLRGSGLSRPLLEVDERMLVEMDALVYRGRLGVASLTSERLIWQYLRTPRLGVESPFARAIPNRIDIVREHVTDLRTGGGWFSPWGTWFELSVSGDEAYRFSLTWRPRETQWRHRLAMWITPDA